jgi:hypothetical protein
MSDFIFYFVGSAGELTHKKLAEMPRYVFSHHIPHFPRLRSAVE